MQKLKSAIKANPKLMPYYEKAYKLAKLMRKLSTNGAYMAWAYVVLEEKKVIYIAMRKVACTSIKTSMLHMESNERNSVISHAVRDSGYLYGKLDREAYKDYFTFTFVRNPFERLISLYENKYHTDYELNKQNGGRLMFDDYLLGYLQKDRGFHSFVKRVCHIPDRLADHHFASQAFTIDRMGQGIQPDYVGKFEHLVMDYEPIRERFDFLPLPHHNKTPKANDWMDYFDLKTAQRVYRRYREDIERFGYQQTYEQLLEHIKARVTES